MLSKSQQYTLIVVLEFFGKYLFKFFQFGANYYRTIRVGILIKFVIFLVVIFGWIKFREGGNFCYNRFVISATFIQLFFIELRFFFLIFIVIKNSTSVLSSFIRPLPI